MNDVDHSTPQGAAARFGGTLTVLSRRVATDMDATNHDDPRGIRSGS